MVSDRIDFLFCMSVLLLRNAALRKTKIFEKLEMSKKMAFQKRGPVLFFLAVKEMVLFIKPRIPYDASYFSI